jgi:hypothetical protein
MPNLFNAQTGLKSNQNQGYKSSFHPDYRSQMAFGMWRVAEV